MCEALASVSNATCTETYAPAQIHTYTHRVMHTLTIFNMSVAAHAFKSQHLEDEGREVRSSKSCPAT